MEELKTNEEQVEAPLPVLADMDWDEVMKLALDRLRQLCRAEKLDATGKKQDLLDRLNSKKNAGRGRFVQGVTRCCVCGANLHVRKTATSREGDRLYIVRQVRCNGKHAHTYPIKDLIEDKNRA